MGLFGIALSALLGLANASEFYYQPAAKTSALTARAGYRYLRRRTESADIKGLYALGLAFNRGITESLSVGAAVSFSSLKQQFSEKDPYGRVRVTDNTADGWEPVVLNLREHEDLGSARLLYGLDFAFGLEQANAGEPNRGYGDIIDGFNRSAVVTPELGFEVNPGRSTFGLLGFYDVYRADSRFSNFGEEGYMRDGKQAGVTAYVETISGDVVVGADFGWRVREDVHAAGFAYPSAVEGFSILNLDAYGRLNVRSESALLAKFGYTTSKYSGPGKNTDDLRLNFAFRQSF